jgi:hypothetical protein
LDTTVVSADALVNPDDAAVMASLLGRLRRTLRRAGLWECYAGRLP